ncbi:MAG: tetratricopeptide repeat protein [Vulcanimicrobiaceae bacterium]
MTDSNADWEKRILDLWAAMDDHDEKEFVALVDSLATELPPGSAIGLFERAGARDSTGHPDLAVPSYKAALDAGWVGERRRRAIIQMASSLRNLGNPQEAVAFAITALSEYLPRYNRSLARYAQHLTTEPS